MIYTKQVEIALVKQNLKIFEGRIPDKVKNLLFDKVLRIEQHGLFFSLCDPYIYPFLLKAIESIKKYDYSKYFPKAVSKLVKNYDWFSQQAAVAEIIVAGYYFEKFRNDGSITVEWERRVPGTNRNVDISLLGLDILVNIEVTGKSKDIRIRKHYDLRYRTKIEIEKEIEKLPDQKYSYIFSIGKKRNNRVSNQGSFEEHIPGFVNFILESRKKGQGKYNFEVDGKTIATVEIKNLQRLKREYADSYRDIWFGWLKDYKRLMNVIVDKAKNQLCPGEINFIYILNLSMFDDLDFQEAFLGKELYHVDINSNTAQLSGRKDGAVNIINKKGYPTVHGLIYSKWDYSKKKIIVNPLVKLEEKILSLIE